MTKEYRDAIVRIDRMEFKDTQHKTNMLFVMAVVRYLKEEGIDVLSLSYDEVVDTYLDSYGLVSVTVK